MTMTEVLTKQPTAQADGKTASDYLAGVKVVDADTHITEWADLWTSRATPKFKDRVPQIRRVDGKGAWLMDDYQLASDSGFAAVKKDGSKAPGLEFYDLGFGDVHPGAHSVRERLAYMDEQGFAAQIGYSNLLGFGAREAMKVDPELRLVSTTILNDAMAELQAESNNRIYPMAMMPWWDLQAMVKEAERCSDMGMRGINMHAFPNEHGLPDLGDPYWTPLWELCEDRKLPVNFHIGFSNGKAGWLESGMWASQPEHINFTAAGVMLFADNMRAIVNLLLSNIFERHPTLKFVSVESGVGWVSFMLEMLEYQMKECIGTLKEPIVDIFRRHFFVCAWFERQGMLDVVRRAGADNVLFETDFPHPTCLYPDPLGYLTPTLAQMTGEERAKVFGGNAQRLYNLDLSAA